MAEILYEDFRNDGRRCSHIRSIVSSFGGNPNPDNVGYVCLEQGNTKIIASVSGPHECRMHSESKHDSAILNCIYNKMPTANFNGGRRNTKRDTRSELNAMCIKSIMEMVVELNWHPGSQIDIAVTVLQSDGSELAVAINAVSLALMDAGVRMKDFVVAASIGLHDQTVLADLNRFEENQSSLPQLTMVLLPNTCTTGSEERLKRIYPSTRIHVSHLKMMRKPAEQVCQAVYVEFSQQIKQYIKTKLEKQHAIEGRATN